MTVKGRVANLLDAFSERSRSPRFLREPDGVQFAMRELRDALGDPRTGLLPALLSEAVEAMNSESHSPLAFERTRAILALLEGYKVFHDAVTSVRAVRVGSFASPGSELPNARLSADFVGHCFDLEGFLPRPAVSSTHALLALARSARLGHTHTRDVEPTGARSRGVR